MTKADIEALAEKIVSGKASAEEIHQYNELFEALQSTATGWDEDILGDRASLEKIIKQAIFQKIETEEKPVVNFRWYRRAAAAAILIIAGAAIWIIAGKQSIPHQIAQQKQPTHIINQDVAPGQEGAILTLGNGSTILLDSANNGSLAKQGSSQINKQNGKIVYNNEGAITEVVYNTMTTPRGRQYQLMLADGTRVWLNAASSITFPTAFNGKERKVSITGEAYFEVAHNDKMPFIVEKNNIDIKVLGTHFNVNTYDDELSVNVTLLKGSVKVSQGSSSNILKPGQQASVKAAGITVADDAAIDEIMAWKDGRFYFEATDIQSIMRQLARWYDVEIVYEKNIDDVFYAEIPRNTNLSNVLKALELTGKVKFEIKDKKIVVSP